MAMVMMNKPGGMIALPYLAPQIKTTADSSDNDGWADVDDEFPEDGEQWKIPMVTVMV